MIPRILSSTTSHALFQLFALLTSLAAEEVQPKEVKSRMPAGLEDAFEVPPAQKDAYGNPVRQGFDEKTGWPLEIRHKATGMHFVFIPAGEFMMGSPDNEKDRDSDEGPVHKVKISKPFYLGKYEVTQAEWEKAMGRNPSIYKKENNPVEGVSWDDCQEFIKKLNAVGALLAAPSGVRASGAQQAAPLRFALPTEAQWEYGCRAETKTRFSFGDKEEELGKYAWFSGNSGRKTHPVGGKTANAWGLYDMHGNVWEWCGDWYGAYDKSDMSDPCGPETHDFRVIRGGDWFNVAGDCRSANRDGYRPGNRIYFLGFRLALSQVQR